MSYRDITCCTLSWLRLALLHTTHIKATCFHRSIEESPSCFRVNDVKESKELTETYSRMGRIGEPIEMAKIMAFMVSDDNAYMSGSEIISDGGLGAVP